MLAKALAAESGATFINIHVSTLTDKWYGESNKLASALFSLARKLQPSIVFIDEIDSFLRERQQMDHEVTAMLKAEFMTHWDGLSSGEQARIVVLGASNRPNDIDPAVLRRMPKRFAVGWPNSDQRRKILEITLKKMPLSPDLSMDKLVAMTVNQSGSDIKELCRSAAMAPVREYIRANDSNLEAAVKQGISIRPLVEEDVSYPKKNIYINIYKFHCTHANTIKSSCRLKVDSHSPILGGYPKTFYRKK